jgi:hypothetical protein
MMNYKKTKKCAVPSQNLEYDSRSKANVTRARNMIATGDKVTVKGTGKARKQTATWI